MSYNIEMNINENGNYTLLYPKVDLGNSISNSFISNVELVWANYTPAIDGRSMTLIINHHCIDVKIMGNITTNYWYYRGGIWGGILYNGNTISYTKEDCYASDMVSLSDISNNRTQVSIQIGNTTDTILQSFLKANTTYTIGFHYITNE